jgi:hypothetical protein
MIASTFIDNLERIGCKDALQTVVIHCRHGRNFMPWSSKSLVANYDRNVKIQARPLDKSKNWQEVDEQNNLVLALTN